MSNHLIKVLLVEDNPGDARLTSTILEEDGGGQFEIVWKPTLAEAVKQLSREPFDVIILDVDLPDSWQLHGLQTILAKAPTIPVVMFTGLVDEELSMSAVEAGAQDCLCKSKDNNETLIRSLRFAVRRNQGASGGGASKGGCVTGFLGAKGGVGVSTLTLNTAALLSRQGSVTVAEFGPGFGSFSAQLTESPNINWSSLAGLSHTGIGEPEVRRCLVKSKFGFDVLFGPQNPDEVKELSTDHARVIVMRLARASGNVLLDLGRSLSTTASMLGLCGRIVVVTDRDPCAVASARVTLRALKAAGVSDEKVSVVVVDRTPLLQASSPQEIEAMLRCSIPGCLPYVGESFYTSHTTGTPLVLLETGKAYASALADLVTNLSLAPAASPDQKPAQGRSDRFGLV